MKSKLVGCLAAAALGAAIVVATPAMAFRDGGGFGGMHGGFGGGGMHLGGGGWRWDAFWWRARWGHAFWGGMPSRGMVTGRSVCVPGGNRFVGAPFAGRQVFVNRFNNFNRFNNVNNVNRFHRFNNFAFRHHHRFRNFAFVGAPFFDDYVLQAWTVKAELASLVTLNTLQKQQIMPEGNA